MTTTQILAGDLTGRKIIATGSDYVTLDDGRRLYLDATELEEVQ